MLKNNSQLLLSFEDGWFCSTPEAQLCATKTIFPTTLTGIIKDIILPRNLSLNTWLLNRKKKIDRFSTKKLPPSHELNILLEPPTRLLFIFSSCLSVDVFTFFLNRVLPAVRQHSTSISISNFNNLVCYFQKRLQVRLYLHHHSSPDSIKRRRQHSWASSHNLSNKNKIKKNGVCFDLARILAK